MLSEILNKEHFEKEDIIQILLTKKPEELELLKAHAQKILKTHSSDKVFLRGLVEISNNCECDCFYCGIRRSNKNVKRFTLDENEIVDIAKWCAEKGFASFVIQSGEIKNEAFISKIIRILRRIKDETKSEKQPDGLGITISLGEHTKETYERFFDAGAHRYLLRIESSNRDLFDKIHPPEQLFDKRIECLEYLKKIGYQVGTGVMIGLPGQTIEDLADDVLFFRDMDIDMLGMGPFFVHKETPFAEYYEENKSNIDEIFQLSLNMIAASRIVLKDVNIASTTALQAIYPDGREQGLNYGANVVMPMLTPSSVRKDYLLYEGKPYLNDGAEECVECLEDSVSKLNREIGFYDYGDSLHYFNRNMS
jgi:biotin synthase